LNLAPERSTIFLSIFQDLCYRAFFRSEGAPMVAARFSEAGMVDWTKVGGRAAEPKRIGAGIKKRQGGRRKSLKRLDSDMEIKANSRKIQGFSKQFQGFSKDFPANQRISKKCEDARLVRFEQVESFSLARAWRPR
jgi:hypothetical protein